MGKSVQDLIDSLTFDKYVTDPLKIEVLNIDNKELTSLEGVSKFKNLTHLYCRQNKLVDLKGVEGLKKLEELDCTDNGTLKSLSGIEGLISLEDLYCGGNSLTSIEEVAGLTNLMRMRCDDNDLDNVESLIGVECLTKLNVFNYVNNKIFKECGSLTWTELLEKVKKKKLERHLKPADDLRGAASISDTGLFDFKMK